MRTTNPALNENTFANARRSSANTMTVRGTTEKTLALLFLVVCGAAYTWDLSRANPSTAGAWIAGGAFGGFILAMVTIFKSAWSPVTAPLYAVAEGLFLGGVSAQFERNYPGLVINAVFLTSGTLASMLVLYRLGVLPSHGPLSQGCLCGNGRNLPGLFRSNDLVVLRQIDSFNLRQRRDRHRLQFDCSRDRGL